MLDVLTGVNLANTLCDSHNQQVIHVQIERDFFFGW